MFWTVVMCLALVAVVVHAFGDGDGEKLFYACLLVLTSGVWLVRILLARRGQRRQDNGQPLP